MSDMTIQEFCDKYYACEGGRKWALENCVSMQDAWTNLKPEWLIWVATRNGVLTDNDLRLFAVWSARQVQHLMTDARSIAALDVAERYARGRATDAELAEAWDAARDAARDAAWDAARDAAGAAARDAARAAALAAAGAAALAAAGAAARAAAGAAAWDAAKAAAWARDAALAKAWADQSEWLRNNTKPNFKKEAES